LLGILTKKLTKKFDQFFVVRFSFSYDFKFSII
jgi:hypothetical protein